MSDPADDLAYDGSSGPQQRDLTPRERDILCRIIGGWWHTLIEIDAEHKGEEPNYLSPQVRFGVHVSDVEMGPFTLQRDELLEDPRVAWLRMAPDEAQLLLNLREVLTPRAD